MKKVIFMVLYLFVSFPSKAYDCGTDLLHKKMMQTDEAYKAAFNQLQNEVYHNLSQSSVSFKQQLFTVPVVVHVIHLGEALGTGSNIDDGQVISSIEGLNDRFSNLIGNGLDIEIQFCLASRSPDGCPTSGINRVDASNISGYSMHGIGPYCQSAAGETLIKNLSKWPVSDYYNIWVVNKILRDDCSQQLGGYAYFPYGGSNDGTVIIASRMNYSSSTLTHELGHALNLYHTFQGDGGDQSCPDNTTCLQDGDRVCDTPPHKQGDCGNSNPCTATGIWDNSVNNYMSYCFPSITDGKFTQNQKDRILATFQSSPRDDLLNSQGCAVPSLNFSFARDNPTCDSLCDGALSIITDCGGNYSYLWNNGETVQNIEFLCGGTYSVTVTAPNGLIDSATTTLEVDPLPNVSFSFPLNQDVACSEQQSIFLPSYANPTGGVFSGNSVSSSTFYPVVAGTGEYVITYKYPNISIDECAVFISDTIEVVECIGVDETNLLENIRIAPNPTFNQLNINWTERVEIEQIDVYDFTGRLLQSVNSPLDNKLNLDVNSLAEGIYFLRFNKSTANTFKFIKLN